DGSSGHVADTLTAILNSHALSEGDVILIEYQDGYNRPAEADPTIWTAVHTVTALGIIVIEPAGNGNVDLDTVAELDNDSRAIIVGAGHSALDLSGIGHDRWLLSSTPPQIGSNYGKRVDCHAYGENVVTAGPALNPACLLGGTTPTNQYRCDFGGTSA